MDNLRFNQLYSTLYENIIRNAKVFGNIRNKDWIYDRAMKGFFYKIEKGEAQKSRKFSEYLHSVATILDSIHNDNWDFDLRPIHIDEVFQGFEISVVILYPEIEVKNSDDLTRTLKELIISFGIKLSSFTDPDGDGVWSPHDIRGTRSSLLFEEWFSGFYHSHLPERKPGSFSNCLKMSSFCLGEETEINDQIESLYVEHTPEGFELFIWTIDSLIKWESLEGVPHKKMETIGVGNDPVIVSNSISSQYLYFRKMFRYITSLDVDFVFSDSRYKIKRNDKFERFLHHYISNCLEDYLMYLLVIKTGSTYYGYSHPRIEDVTTKFKKRGEQPFFYLRNKKIEFKVEPYDGELPDINNYKVHPKFIEYAAQQLEKKLYEKSVRKCTIEKYHQVDNIEANI